MSNEAEIIDNPDSTPSAVSTGYQLQNTNMISVRAGVDKTVIIAGSGEAVLKIGAPVDVNGVLYSIKSEVAFTLSSAGRYFVALLGSGASLTPTLTSDSGTFDFSKNGRYDGSGNRILNWIIDTDGTLDGVNVSKLFTPEITESGQAHNYIPDIDQPPVVYIEGMSNTDWTAPRSKFYTIEMCGRGGNGGSGWEGSGSSYTGNPGKGGGASLKGIKRIFIEAGTVWSTSFSSLSGGNCTFSDGSTLLSVQNGYAGTPSSAGAGGTSISGFDISLSPGEDGQGNSGGYLMGPIGRYVSSSVGSNGFIGSGGGGGSGGSGSGNPGFAGGQGGNPLIIITG